MIDTFLACFKFYIYSFTYQKLTKAAKKRTMNAVTAAERINDDVVVSIMIENISFHTTTIIMNPLQSFKARLKMCIVNCSGQTNKPVNNQQDAQIIDSWFLIISQTNRAQFVTLTLKLTADLLLLIS